MPDYDFQIELDGFNEGLGPLAHLDDKSFVGNSGQASEMRADIISKAGYVTQSPGLADLTNGNEDGVVDQLIRFILDQPVAVDTTFGVGTTKLFKLGSSSVSSGGSPSWPQTITGMTEGESIARVGDSLLVFYNTSSAGDIASMDLSTETIDPDWGSTTDEALEKSSHPVAVKEDICIFGNGRYAGVLILGLNELNTKKLDFGEGAEVVDVVFASNSWWIAVNYGFGKQSRVFMYSGGALSNQLDDEAGVGDQQIGFLYVHNGIIFIAYEDTSSDGYIIGWLSGRQIKPLRYFKGSLPNHRQKALYKNTIIFASGENVLSVGATVEQLPLQISVLADAGHATIGAIASPFGVPMVASTSGTAHRLAKFSGYSTASNWKSVLSSTTRGRELGMVQTVIVYTKPLLENARADIYIEGNQGSKTSNALQVTGLNKTRHIFKTVVLPAVEDIRAVVDFTNGNTTNDCPIRKIVILGNFTER